MRNFALLTLFAGLCAWYFSNRTASKECTKVINKGDPNDPVGGRLSTSEQVNSKELRLWSLDEDVYPFGVQEQFLDISQFLGHLYNDEWIKKDLAGRTYQYTLEPIGRANLQPDRNEPVTNTQNPRWRTAEVWRVLNVLRALLAVTKEDPRYPVAKFLDKQTGNALSSALFPDSLKAILKTNEALIARGQGQWVGFHPLQGRPTDVPPFDLPNIQVPLASENRIGFYQRGGVGPLSIEAAFILATQLAGINFQTVKDQYKGTGLWWTGAIVPPPNRSGNTGSCMEQSLPKAEGSRRFGFCYRPSSTQSNGDQRAGFFLALEVDGSRTNDPNRNVFIFAVHAIDIHSRIQIPDEGELSALRYRTYTPAAGQNDAPYPGTPVAPYGSPNTTGHTYFVAHAHSAIMRYVDLATFLTQSGNQGVDLPEYTQVGFNHLYIQSELESQLWPRRAYVNLN